MAIYYEPDDTSRGTLPRDPGLKVTGQSSGDTDDDRQPYATSKCHKLKNPGLCKQRWLQAGAYSPAQPIDDIKREESPSRVPRSALKRLFTGNDSLDSDREGRGPLLGEEAPSDLATDNDNVQSCSKQEMTSISSEFKAADIERPGSALHTGDFFEQESSHLVSKPPSSSLAHSTSSPGAFVSSYPTTPWYTPEVSSLSPHSTESGIHSWSRPVNTRTRAPSLGSSLHSNFVFRPPTSPLVYAASNSDLDFGASANVMRQSPSPEMGTRRRTLPSESFHSFPMDSSKRESAKNFSRHLMLSRREFSFPYQAHQPRRSLTFATADHTTFSVQPPASPRYRRPSLSSDQSPLQHASMVGSFEESILRGRMSTAPSKPLDFVAQIGVLGRGDCKPNLRCPAHVTVPFPAVFYNYPSIGKRSFSDDNPSPYVGTIDLEHSLRPVEAMRIRKRRESPAPSVHDLMRDVTAPEHTHIGLAIDRKMREMRPRRPVSPKGPLGGCYRIPQQGQLQIVIKNPNKTAVKLYLVPYSLDGMEAGTKTFVRQRSFSAGPILEKALTDKPQAPLPDPLQHKPVLRYLIHLKFCCPSKSRYYLYDNIRVVFANRVPDGKESLKNEVQLPEPRYSPYRSFRERSMGRVGTRLAAEKASRRRSSGLAFTSANFEAMDGLTFTGAASNLLPKDGAPPAPFAILPFHLVPAPARTGSPSVNEETSRKEATGETDKLLHILPPTHNAIATDLERTGLRTPGFKPSMSARASPLPWATFDLNVNDLDRHSLSGAVSSAPGECGEGLLAKELKSMEAQKSKDKYC